MSNLIQRCGASFLKMCAGGVKAVTCNEAATCYAINNPKIKILLRCAWRVPNGRG
jgi:hypothetical protein